MPRAKRNKIVGPSTDLLSTLSNTEVKYFNDRFQIMFEQADSDPVLEPTIRNIILNDIIIARLQSEIQMKSINPDELTTLEKLTRVVNSLQEKNLDALESLNLTKAKKDALHKSPESTPSKIITAYALAISTMSVVEREKNKKDIEEAMERLKKNSTDLLDIIPSEIEEEKIAFSE